MQVLRSFCPTTIRVLVSETEFGFWTFDHRVRTSVGNVHRYLGIYLAIAIAFSIAITIPVLQTEEYKFEFTPDFWKRFVLYRMNYFPSTHTTELQFYFIWNCPGY